MVPTVRKVNTSKSHDTLVVIQIAALVIASVPVFSNCKYWLSSLDIFLYILRSITKVERKEISALCKWKDIKQKKRKWKSCLEGKGYIEN